MLKTFQIDYVRALLDYAFSKNIGNNDYFTNSDIHIFSFFEHLTENEEIDRYVETYKQLIEQQNKQYLVGFGIVSATNTPSIVNQKKSFISPFEWSCTIRTALENRDKMIITLYKMFDEFKGRKVDIALLNNGKLWCVGTIGNNMTKTIENFDYIGTLTIPSGGTATNAINTMISNIGYTNNATKVYVSYSNKLSLFEYVASTSQGTTTYSWVENEDYVPSHASFEKYKLGVSFTDIKMAQPYTLDAQEYCEITFGGGATLTQDKIRLGNDLVFVEIAKNKIVCSNDGTGDYFFGTTQTNGNVTTYLPIYHILEPLDLSSGSSSSNIANKLRSNFFTENSHTDSVVFSMEYTFVIDDDTLVNQWYNFSKYGDYGLSNGSIVENSITPNIIYNIRETYSHWGIVETKQVLAKIAEDISVEQSDSDVLTIKIPFQLQGENN